MNNERGKILCVEDDPVLGHILSDFLRKKDYDVTFCINGENAWNKFAESNFDACLVDVLLPGDKDGLYLVGKIRKRNENVPIILLSSLNADNDKKKGFDTGADDYITKPYNLQEVLLRMQVFLNRSKEKFVPPKIGYNIGDAYFDYGNLTMSNDTRSFELTQREADILKYLCDNRARIITRFELILNIWGSDDVVNNRSLDVFLTRVRKYLKIQTDVKLYTVHGRGFRFDHSNLLVSN